MLGLYAEEAIAVLKRKSIRLDAVAVSAGPGSYTGLRIGVSLAKGLCFGFNIPLISVLTLELLASRAIRFCGDVSCKEDASGNVSTYCAMLDARRMEVYAAIYDADLQPVRLTAADIVTPATYAPYLEAGKVYFFGNGAAKCKTVITSPNAVFIDGIYPLAADMAPIAEARFRAGKFEDVAYFEPFYLKEFQATIAKNKVLRPS